MFAVGIERLFRDLDACIFQFVDEGQERELSGVGHGEYRAGAGDLAGQCRGIVERNHLRLENRGIGDADNFHIEEMSEGPAGVIVRMLLRVAGGPELAVEQRIGDAGVGLIHANDDAAGGEGFLLRFVCALFGGDCGSDRVGELFDLDMLALHCFEQLYLAIRVGWVGGDHISGRAFERSASRPRACSWRRSSRGNGGCCARSKKWSRAERFLRNCYCRAATSSLPEAADSGGTRCANNLPGRRMRFSVSAPPLPKVS